MTRSKGAFFRSLAGTVAVLGLVSFAGVANASVGAGTVDYPSWADVQAARASTANAQQAVARIQVLLSQMQQTLLTVQTEEQAAGTAYREAQRAYDEQSFIASSLDAQAKSAEVEAKGAQQTAQRFIGALGRAGGGDLTTSLITQPGRANDLLYRLSALGHLSAQSEGVFAKALRLKNSAAALAAQAIQAQTKRGQLSAVAEDSFTKAQVASDAAAAALTIQQQHQQQLQAQLAVLVQHRQATEADYNAGVAARNAATAVGQVNGQNWARPTGGYIISGFGMRLDPITKAIWGFHGGVDITGRGCGAPIFAAHAGRVTYSGRYGDLGNYIQIDHGDGTSTGYGHIVDGGLLVARGQDVTSGQQIARVGTTGASTGCHLHFITRINGQLVDPVPFMRARGVSLG